MKNEKIGIDRAEGEGCFLSEGQEDGHEMNGTNRKLSIYFHKEYSGNFKFYGLVTYGK